MYFRIGTTFRRIIDSLLLKNQNMSKTAVGQHYHSCNVGFLVKQLLEQPWKLMQSKMIPSSGQQ